MAFEHLSYARVQEIVTAFLSLPSAYDHAMRSALFTGVDPGFTNLLPVGGNPMTQLLNDVGQLNRLERLADGSVPFVIWLGNAAMFAGPTDAAKVFLRARSDVERRAAGAPKLDLATLPEMKEVVIHENDMVSFAFMQAGVEAGRAVAKLMVPRHEQGAPVMNPNPVIFLGTGWLLSSRLMMTNHHVVNARRTDEPPASAQDFNQQGLAMTAKFDFDSDNEQGVDVGVSAVEAWDAALDYAIVRLASDTGRRPLSIAPAVLTLPANTRVPVNVVQHPLGSSKKYGIRNNLVSRTTPTDVRYFTDTDGGSSGSPVLDDRWKVVALHRGATYADGVTFQGRSTAYVNVGTQVQAIFSDVKARYPTLAGELQIQ